MNKRKLPIGVQDFKQLREENLLYIDKTAHIHRLVTEGYYYFLSRPRRFGKTLLFSTLEALFRGEKHLFEGLYIADKWDWEKKYPVVRITFAASGYHELGLLEAIREILALQAHNNNIELQSKSVVTQFAELIRKLHDIHQQKVVVLIDEYDKPIIDYLDNPEKASENRQILRDFYLVLKSSSAHLQFIFLTGVSKFSQISIFSALNHLIDISMNHHYSTLLGYTETELNAAFYPYMQEIVETSKINLVELQENIKKWYNGYSWDGKTTVYNPFSILNFFNESKFKNYWFATGTPTFLTVLAQKQRFYDLEEIELLTEAFDSFDIEDLNPHAIMFQTGYLTIKKYDENSQIYTLGYPNFEVRKSFLTYMLSAYTFSKVYEVSAAVTQMQLAFEKNDLNTVVELTNAMFAGIPYQIFEGNSEKYFHSMLHLLLSYLGTNIQSEINTNKGRLDAVVHTPQYLYILEFKYNKSAEIALNDIENRAYKEKYASQNKKIIAVGINFSTEHKGINDWKTKIL